MWRWLMKWRRHLRLVFKRDQAYSPQSHEAEFQSGHISTQYGRDFSIRQSCSDKERAASGGTAVLVPEGLYRPRAHLMKKLGSDFGNPVGKWAGRPWR